MSGEKVAIAAVSGAAPAGGSVAAAGASLLTGGAVIIGAVVIAGVAYQSAKLAAEEARKAQLAHHNRAIRQGRRAAERAISHPAIRAWATEADMEMLRDNADKTQAINASDDLATARRHATQVTELTANSQRLVSRAVAKDDVVTECGRLTEEARQLMPDTPLQKRQNLLDAVAALRSESERKTDLRATDTVQLQARVAQLAAQHRELRKTCAILNDFQTYLHGIREFAWAAELDTGILNTLAADADLDAAKAAAARKVFDKQCEQRYENYLQQLAEQEAAEAQARQARYAELRQAVETRAARLEDLKRVYFAHTQALHLQVEDKLSTLEQNFTLLFDQGQEAEIHQHLQAIDELAAQIPQAYAEHQAAQAERDRHMEDLQKQLNVLLDSLETRTETEEAAEFRDDLEEYREAVRELPVTGADSDDREEAQELEREIQDLAQRIQTAYVYHYAQTMFFQGISKEEYDIQEDEDSASGTRRIRFRPKSNFAAFRSATLNIGTDKARIETELVDGEIAQLEFTQTADGAFALRTVGDVAEGSASCETFKRIVESDALREFAAQLQLEIRDHHGELLNVYGKRGRARDNDKTLSRNL